MLRLQGASNSQIAAFNEAFAHEHCSISKQAECSSNLADAVVNADSSKHRMNKYKFLCPKRLRPRPLAKPHPDLPLLNRGGLFAYRVHASVLPSIKEELSQTFKGELEFVELGRSHPRLTQTEKQRYSKAISALDIWHILEKTGR